MHFLSMWHSCVPTSLNKWWRARRMEAENSNTSQHSQLPQFQKKQSCSNTILQCLARKSGEEEQWKLGPPLISGRGMKWSFSFANCMHVIVQYLQVLKSVIPVVELCHAQHFPVEFTLQNWSQVAGHYVSDFQSYVIKQLRKTAAPFSSSKASVHVASCSKHFQHRTTKEDY